MYIKLNNGVIEKYPYTINDIRKDNPQVSFPQTISQEILDEYNVYEVIEVSHPVVTYKQNLIEGTPVNNNGIWTQVWNVTDKPLDEINAIQEKGKKQAYIEESDPLFFKWQRGEIEKQEWLDKVAEIKQRWM